MRDRHALLLLLGFFLAAIVIAAPWGAHPINDDWTHTRAIAAWMETGSFVYPAWLSAFLYVPIGYGMVLAKVFGFSFLLFRLTNVVFAAGTLALFFFTLRRSGIPQTSALLVTALLAANPLFFLLATTAMGDMPALFFLVLAAFCHVHAFDPAITRARYLWLAAGSAAFALAFYTRQAVGFYFIGMLIGVLAQPRVRWRMRRVSAAVAGPIVIVGAIIALFHLPAPTQTASHLLPEGWSLLRHVVLRAWHFFLLGGLFMLPVVAAFVARRPAAIVTPSFVAPLLIGLSLPALALWKRHSLFGVGNLLTPHGFGPTVGVLQGTLPPLLGPNILGVLTIVCFVSGALMLRTLWLTRTALLVAARRWTFLWMYAALTFVVLLFVQSFDRYLLLLLPAPFAALALVSDARPWSTRVAAVGVFVMLVISVIGTHDAHAWQRARWTLGERLLARGIPADRIEGGYEWDGWQLYGEERETLPGRYTPFWAPWWARDLFPGHPMTYILAFSELGGYRAIDREPIRAWFFPVAAIIANEIVPR